MEPTKDTDFDRLKAMIERARSNDSMYTSFIVRHTKYERSIYIKAYEGESFSAYALFRFNADGSINSIQDDL